MVCGSSIPCSVNFVRPVLKWGAWNRDVIRFWMNFGWVKALLGRLVKIFFAAHAVMWVAPEPGTLEGLYDQISQANDVAWILADIEKMPVKYILFKYMMIEQEKIFVGLLDSVRGCLRVILLQK